MRASSERSEGLNVRFKDRDSTQSCVSGAFMKSRALRGRGNARQRSVVSDGGNGEHQYNFRSKNQIGFAVPPEFLPSEL